MAYTPMLNGDEGLIARQKINSQFNELYSGLPSTPYILRNKIGSVEINYTSETYVDKIFVKKLSGVTSIKIGTTLGGEEILTETLFEGTQTLKTEWTFQNGNSMFITLSGYTDLRIEQTPQLI